MSNGDLLDKERERGTQQGDNAVERADVEALLAEAKARQAKAQLEITQANKETEIINKERLASDEVKALAGELAELQLKLDKDRVAVDDKESELGEAYALKVYQVDAGVDERIRAGIKAGMTKERAAIAKAYKVCKEMYNRGLHWAVRFCDMVKLQSDYSVCHVDKDAQEDIVVRGKAMMETGGFPSILGEKFNFESQPIGFEDSRSIAEIFSLGEGYEEKE